jgi:23S rRNA (cytosine1962-C5)-methyltransferase
MNGATYMADLTGGQKTGLFYDQRPNHAFAARLAGGRGCSTCFPMWAASRWRRWRGARDRRWPSMAPPRALALAAEGAGAMGRGRASPPARAMPSTR